MLLGNNMLYFSFLLKTIDKYKPAAERLFAALTAHGVPYKLLDNTRDIWLRDFMPIKTKSGKYVSFRYEPSYLKNYSHLKTDFRKEIAPSLSLENLVYSEINLDGGNIVLSPSREIAIISDRIFMENREYSSAALVQKLEQLLEARVIIIPSLRSDMTGHADGMVRFMDENCVIGNCVPSKNGLEQRIKSVLQDYGIAVIDFPYYFSPKGSAVGCYLNFLETDEIIFLPAFGADMDIEAIETAKNIFNKQIIPIRFNEIARDSGGLNCISWEH